MEWNPSFARLASGFEGLRPSKLYDAHLTFNFHLVLWVGSKLHADGFFHKSSSRGAT